MLVKQQQQKQQQQLINCCSTSMMDCAVGYAAGKAATALRHSNPFLVSFSGLRPVFNLLWLIPSKMVPGPTCNYPLSNSNKSPEQFNAAPQA